MRNVYAFSQDRSQLPDVAGGYALCGVLRSKYAVSAQWLQQSLEGFYFSYQYDMEFHIFFSYDIITKIEDDDKLNITDS